MNAPLQSSRTGSVTAPLRRPVIGITMGTDADRSSYKLGQGYAQGVERAGGLPLGLCYGEDPQGISQQFDILDGIIFSGGDDLDPALYGQTRHPSAEPIDPARQRYELALWNKVERRRLPVLGICLGAQVINVARGGSLHQFLPDLVREGALEHRRLDAPVRRHDIQIEAGTRLRGIIGQERLSTNTYHKQAVDRVGRGLVVTAHSSDGVIEGLEDPGLPFLVAVQWHPERLIDEEAHLRLFKGLVDAARDWMLAERCGPGVK